MATNLSRGSTDSKSSLYGEGAVLVEREDFSFWAMLFDVLPAQIEQAVGLVGARPDAVERYVRQFGYGRPADA